jgi:hypothetical protein
MTKVTRKAATKAKTGGTKTATKGAAKAKAAPKESEGKARRTQADVDALVPEFLSRIEDGATLRALKAEFGFSDDGPIRAALYRAGYDRKGEAHGEDAGSIDASKAAGKKQLVALRANEGAAWYRLAYLAGITEAEAKTIVSEAGGETGRVYVKTEKPAKAEKAGKTNGGTAAKKSGGKKVKRADPSPQA